ncbi:MAG: hypothetical protein HZC37_17985 [Burkholderiales bacterium]|nr:hypothetical protein [Burkholderiales bacterium]
MCTSVVKGLALVLLLCLGTGCQSIVDTVQGRAMNEITVGQVAAGSINRQVDARLRVRTTMSPGRSYRTCWQSTTGRGSGTLAQGEQCSSGQELQVRNEYSRTETVTGSASLWRIDARALPRPTRVLLLVRGRGFRPLAALFIDVADSALEASPSIALIPSGERGDEVAGIIELHPGRRYVLAVQSAEPRDADFQVALVAVTRHE